VNSDLLQGFYLGDLLVEPLKGQVTGRAGSHHLPPKAVEVLLCLASTPGELVARETLLDDVWGVGNGSQEALSHAISEIRHALGDDADDPVFLQTLPKRGYRLIVDPSLACDQSAAGTGSKQADSTIRNQVRDLRKRKVFQAVLGYPVLAWLLLQIVDILWEYLLAPLGAPAWLVPSFFVLLVVGYPVAVFFTWAVDLTPEGIQISEAENESKPVAGLIGIGVIAMVGSALALFVYFNAYEPPESAKIVVGGPVVPPVKFDKSIAVLRFENIGASQDVDYIGDGMTEELIHALVNLKSIKVAARTSIWQLSNTQLAFKDIADRLGVEKILEGSVRVDGNNLRVTTQLIDEEGFHLWSKTYDRKLDDILEIQKDIALQVVGELEVLLTSDIEARLNTKLTDSGAAYDKYLQGRHFLRMPNELDSLNLAQSYFEASISLDNRFPLSFAGLCKTNLARYRLTRDTDYFREAELMCHRALTLDGGLAEVYTALGDLYRHSGQFQKAEQEYMAALRINSTIDGATFGLGRAYQGQGRLIEAEKMLLRSVELEPGYWGSYMGIGNFLYRQGRYEESIPHYENVTRLAPDYAGGFINLGSSLHWFGDWSGAEIAWQRALQLSQDSMSYQNMGTLRFYQHRFEDAVEMYRRAVDVSPQDHRNWGKLAAAQRFVAGRADEARASYEKAIALVEIQLEVNPNESEDWYFLSVYRLRTGDVGRSRQAVTRSLELTPKSPNTLYFSALLELDTGNREKSIDQLEKAAEFGYSLMLLGADPDLESLHDEDRFRALIGKNK